MSDHLRVDLTTSPPSATSVRPATPDQVRTHFRQLQEPGVEHVETDAPDKVRQLLRALNRRGAIAARVTAERILRQRRST